MIDAVAQTTKQGFLYLFERTTGNPLFPIEEKPYPTSDVPGEVASRRLNRCRWFQRAVCPPAADCGEC